MLSGPPGVLGHQNYRAIWVFQEHRATKLFRPPGFSGPPGIPHRLDFSRSQSCCTPVSTQNLRPTMAFRTTGLFRPPGFLDLLDFLKVIRKLPHSPPNLQ
ncbi:unnamed protein product [Caenorhabditis brenneri]